MKMRKVHTVLVVSGLALLILLMSAAQPQNMYGAEYEVRVINGFRNNSSLPLVIWCSSEESEMGGRALQEGDDFGWRVRTNLWGTSHFLCTIKWNEKRRRFDAFVVARDSSRCGPLRRCSWLVREDGFYFSNDEVNWNKDFSWFV